MATITPLPTLPQRHWNTLQLLGLCRAVLLVFDALLLIALLVGITVHRDAMKVIGKDAAPSIISAQHIKSSLADMDAQAVNELLAPPSAAGTLQATAAGPVQAYESKRIEAADALIAAAENITYGASERVPIQTLQVGLGSYERLIQKARDLHEIPASTANTPAASAAYREAATFMDTTLLPAADALDQANHDVLERTYNRQSTTTFAARVFATLAALLTIGALLLTQTFLSRRTRRTFNPLLLLATLLTIALAAWSLASLTEEQHQLKIAKEDAFTSIHALWRARAIAYQARSAQGRALFDPAHAAVDEQAFSLDVDSLARLPPSVTPQQMRAILQENARPPVFSGYLADELNNTTFSGEREAALGTLAHFEQYVILSAEVRRLEHAGQHRPALELSQGLAPGQAGDAFDQFDTALGATLSLNQSAFDRAVAQGTAALRNAEIKVAVTALLIAVLIFLGFAARIREYQ